jgi:hypothetical protein
VNRRDVIPLVLDMELAGASVVRAAEAAMREEKRQELERSTGSEFVPAAAAQALSKELKRVERERDAAEEKERRAEEEGMRWRERAQESDQLVRGLKGQVREAQGAREEAEGDARLHKSHFESQAIVLQGAIKERNTLKTLVLALEGKRE